MVQGDSIGAVAFALMQDVLRLPSKAGPCAPTTEAELLSL